MSDSDGLVGHKIGNYQITRLLGEGGMGAVYLGENPKIESKVAIKLLHPMHGMDPAILKRFIGEAKAVNRVGHPGIVRIHDFGQEDDVGTYLVMEHLEGRVLRDELKARGKLPGVEVANILSQAASTLGEVHKKAIIHRDLKPENMFLVPDVALPGGTRVKILDFGIAKLTEEGQGMGSATMTGVVFGSPNYMSHEQCCDTKNVDLRTDIYSLGVIGYELLTGKIPYKGESLGDLVRKQLMEVPPPPSLSNPDCTEALDRVVLKALSVEPDRRFATMDDLVTAIHMALDGVPPEALEEDDSNVTVDIEGSGSRTVGLASKPKLKLSEMATVPPKPRKETTRGVGAVGTAQAGEETAQVPPPEDDVLDTEHSMAAVGRSPTSKLVPAAVVIVLLAGGVWGVWRFAGGHEQGTRGPAARTTSPGPAPLAGKATPTPSRATPPAAPAPDSGSQAASASPAGPSAAKRRATAVKGRHPRKGRAAVKKAAHVEAAAPEVTPAKIAKKPVEQPFRSLGGGAPKKKTPPDEERPFDSLGPPVKKNDDKGKQ